MGGNLLKRFNLPQSRIPNSEYHDIVKEIITIFKNSAYNPVICQAPPSLRKKESHGDIDFVLGINGPTKWLFRQYNSWLFLSIDEFIEKTFGYKPICNDSTYSFPYKGYQMDIKVLQAKDLQSYVHYNSWGDTSNLMGRIFHKMGLSYGHLGLTFYIRKSMFDNDLLWSNDDHIMRQVVLSQDMREICEIGSFNYEQWAAGFDTEEDVFNFIASSKFFRKDIFLLENLNHINRIRNKKRSFYTNFIEWCKTTNPPDNIESFLDKRAYALIFQDRFPHLRQQIGESFFNYKLHNLIKSRINGNILMEKYGVTKGPDLSKIISSIKAKYSNIELIQISDSILDEEIKLLISNN